MLDVKSTRAVRRGASDRHLYIKGKSVDQLAAELIDETLMSLVASYDCRNFCRLRLRLLPRWELPGSNSLMIQSTFA